MQDSATTHNKHFGKMAGSVQNSTTVFQLNFCTKLNICAQNSASSQSRKTVGCKCKGQQQLQTEY